MSVSRPGSILRRQTPKALAEVLGTPGRVMGFVAASGVVAFCYTLLLPFEYTQRLGLANWSYLDAYLLVWAIALGLAMGLVVSIQVYAMRRIAVARAASGAASGAAFVVSLLPSFLCCTPIVPSLLAFVGVSGIGLYTTTGTLQHFFALHQTEFLSSSVVLLAGTCWWGLRKVARAQCLVGDGCGLGTTPGGAAGVILGATGGGTIPAEGCDDRPDGTRPTGGAASNRRRGRRQGARS